MKDAVIKKINSADTDEAADIFRKCCGSAWWCNQMTDDRPFTNADAVATAADAAFDQMPRDAWLEAFAAHPQIGDLQSLRMKYAGNREWSAGEQSGAADADENTLQRLAAGNAEYLNRFGYIFIVCATGKTAAEMLALLEARLGNAPEAELPIAAAEQRKITHLRLAKLAESHD